MPVLLFLRALGMGVFGFLRKLEPFQLLSLALGIALLFVGAQRNGARHDRDAWHRQFTAEHKARAADRASYVAAQRQADEKNRADVRAKEEQYKRNNDEAVGNLNARIERLRRELRNPSAPGSAGGSSLPQADNPSGASGQAPVCLTPEELLHGAENEERFDQLITLILKQTR